MRHPINRKRQPEGMGTVQIPSSLISCERLGWVDSRRLAKSYIESVPTTEFGATTDIRQALGYDM